MFGTVERKARGFEQLYRTDGQAREIEDIGDETLTFGELKAAAAGNDLLLRQHELQTRVRKLRLAHTTIQQNVRTLQSQASMSDKSAEASAARAKRLEAFAEHQGAGMRSIDLAGVAVDACVVRDPNRYYPSYRAAWSDHRVSIRVVDTDPGQRLELAFDHRSMWSEPLPGKVRRRGPDVVKAWAEAMVAAWIAGVEREIVQTRGRMAESQRRADESRKAAAAADVSEPAELIAARAELAEVNKAIDDAVKREDPPAAAA